MTIPSPIYSLIDEVYTDGGYHLLGMADQGFRVMSTNKKIRKRKGKGQKMQNFPVVRIALDFSRSFLSLCGLFRLFSILCRFCGLVYLW